MTVSIINWCVRVNFGCLKICVFLSNLYENQIVSGMYVCVCEMKSKNSTFDLTERTWWFEETKSFEFRNFDLKLTIGSFSSRLHIVSRISNSL